MGGGGILYAHAPTPNSHIDAARIKKKKNRGVDGERTQIQTPTKGGGGGGAPLKCDNQPTNQHVTFFDRSSANPLLFLGGGRGEGLIFATLFLCCSAA